MWWLFPLSSIAFLSLQEKTLNKGKFPVNPSKIFFLEHPISPCFIISVFSWLAKQNNTKQSFWLLESERLSFVYRERFYVKALGTENKFVFLNSMCLLYWTGVSSSIRVLYPRFLKLFSHVFQSLTFWAS